MKSSLYSSPIYDNVYSKAAINRIEKQRQKIRHDALQFLNKKRKLQIIDFPENKVFDYSPHKDDLLDLGKSKGVFIAKNLRKNEDLNKKYNLRVFHILSFYDSKRRNISTCLTFLKYFCKAEMGRIGIVSITNDNKLGIPGIEPYLDIFYKYGIQEHNILIRKNVEKAFKAGDGDGYWMNKSKPKYQGPTFSIHVPLKYGADIKNYENKEEWLEVAECGIGGNIEGGFDFGMERIELYFFGVAFPRNK